jgi:type III pantothenate kinase
MKSRKIVIDLGNTLTKVACLENARQVEFYTFGEDADFFQWINQQTAFDCGILGSVRHLPVELEKWVSNQPEMIILNSNTPLPFKIAYKSPDTLGPDRIALAAAGFERFPHQNVLVIDMGSCITYDLLTSQGIYLGGAISPGIRMRFRAMHQFTAKLPLAEPTEHSPLIGTDTGTSLQSGVMQGVQAEIAGIIEQYERNYKDLTVLIGGGDNKYFDKRFKVNIFAASNLVLDGLRFIMEFNQSQ